jgi:predicted pyridoxine 5'-phosphate oxidase superfamily flavin-nucleotide-binding protein
MMVLNDRVKALLDSQPLWYVATCSDEPEVSMIGFKEILDDGRLLLCDVFMKKSYDNIMANGKLCIAIANPETMEGYQISGTAEYITEGSHMEIWKENAAAFSGGRLAPKGIVIVTPECVRIAAPSRTNGKVLD